MSTHLSTYRYGSPRQAQEGLRLGVARFLPRGVRRQDWARLGHFDHWLPLLAPAPEDIKAFRAGEITFEVFSRRYRAEMKKREPRQVIELLAGLSLFFPLSLGCYCEDESRCHRSLLHQLITLALPKKFPGLSSEFARYSSPVCFAPWAEDLGE